MMSAPRIPSFQLYDPLDTIIYIPISASCSFSAAVSTSSCDILAATSFEASVESSVFLPLAFLLEAFADMAGVGVGAGRGSCAGTWCPLDREGSS